MADAGGKGKSDANLKDDPVIQQLISTVGTLAKGQQSLQDGFKGLQEMLAKGIPTKEKDPPKEKETTDDEVNNMSQSELVSHMMKGVRGMLDDTVKGIKDSVSGLGEKLTTTTMDAEVREFKRDHPDVVEWGPELKDILTDNPTLSLDRAYKLVRDENPEKVEKLKEKYDVTEDKDTETVFGGLTPTSGRTVEEMMNDKEKLTKSEAMDKAWEETVAQFPGLATSTDENFVEPD